MTPPPNTRPSGMWGQPPTGGPDDTVVDTPQAAAGGRQRQRPARPTGHLPEEPVWIQGERVWCWYGAATGSWWAFVPREARLGRLPDRLVEAASRDVLHGEVGRVLGSAV